MVERGDAAYRDGHSHRHGGKPAFQHMDEAMIVSPKDLCEPVALWDGFVDVPV